MNAAGSVATLFTALFDIQDKPQIPFMIAFPSLIILIVIYFLGPFRGKHNQEEKKSSSVELKDNLNLLLILIIIILVVALIFSATFSFYDKPTESMESSNPLISSSPHHTEEVTDSIIPVLPSFEATTPKSDVEPSQPSYIDDSALLPPEPVPPALTSAPSPVVSDNEVISDNISSFPIVNLPQDIVFDIYCADDPAFTDYYVEFSSPNSLSPTRYFPSALPIRYSGSEGFFALQFYRASTGEWFSSYPSIYARPGERYSLSFSVPNSEVIQNIFTLDVYCEEQPSFTDYYVELYIPEVDYPARFIASDFPAYVTVEPGQYKIFVYQSSDGALLFEDTFFAERNLKKAFGFYLPVYTPVDTSSSMLNENYALFIDDSKYTSHLDKPASPVPAGCEVFFHPSGSQAYELIVSTDIGETIPIHYIDNTFYFTMPHSNVYVKIWDVLD